jgi:hypothetical protein
MFHAPETSTDDERFISNGYGQWQGPVMALIPFAVANYADTKWVVATGFALGILLLNEIGGRLYDLCIRLRRTNLILRRENSN